MIELAAGADPYFANVDPNQDNAFYLSQDLRVFTITPTTSGSAPVDGVQWSFQGGSPLNFDSAAAYQYIRDVLDHFNSAYSDPNGVDPFDVNNPRLPSQGDVYGGDSTVTPASVDFSLFPPIALDYNFAIARVRLQGSSGAAGQASNVKVFFRLFTTQTSDTDYINTPSAVSAGDPNITYPSLPTGSPDQPASPLPGTDGGGTINGCTLPYFAATDQSDLAPGGDNNQTIIIPAGRDKTWAYFGCFLDVYDSSYQVGGFDSQHWLAGSSHCCLVAQIAYDDLPIRNSNGVIENPANCAQLAQRNLQVTLSGNPGFPATHLIPQTFDTRPSQPPATDVPLGDYPDELMIDWRNTPPGTTATIYWPAVDSGDVIALAARLYPSSGLAAVDAHTLECEVTPGMTYVPVPTSAGESFAGLITLQLPSGIHVGNEFDVVIRRITSRRYNEPPVETIGATSRGAVVRDGAGTEDDQLALRGRRVPDDDPRGASFVDPARRGEPASGAQVAARPARVDRPLVSRLEGVHPGGREAGTRPRWRPWQDRAQSAREPASGGETPSAQATGSRGVHGQGDRDRLRQVRRFRGVRAPDPARAQARLPRSRAKDRAPRTRGVARASSDQRARSET